MQIASRTVFVSVLILAVLFGGVFADDSGDNLTASSDIPGDIIGEYQTTDSAEPGTGSGSAIPPGEGSSQPGSPGTGNTGEEVQGNDIPGEQPGGVENPPSDSSNTLEEGEGQESQSDQGESTTENQPGTGNEAGGESSTSLLTDTGPDENNTGNPDIYRDNATIPSGEQGSAQPEEGINLTGELFRTDTDTNLSPAGEPGSTPETGLAQDQSTNGTFSGLDLNPGEEPDLSLEEIADTTMIINGTEEPDPTLTIDEQLAEVLDCSNTSGYWGDPVIDWEKYISGTETGTNAGNWTTLVYSEEYGFGWVDSGVAGDRTDDYYQIGTETGGWFDTTWGNIFTLQSDLSTAASVAIRIFATDLLIEGYGYSVGSTADDGTAISIEHTSSVPDQTGEGITIRDVDFTGDNGITGTIRDGNDGGDITITGGSFDNSGNALDLHADGTSNSSEYGIGGDGGDVNISMPSEIQGSINLSANGGDVSNNTYIRAGNGGNIRLDAGIVNTSFLHADISGGSHSKGYSYGSIINGSGGSIVISADTLNVSDGGVQLISLGRKGGSVSLDTDEISTPALMMYLEGTNNTADIRSKNLTVEYLVVVVSPGSEDPSYGTVDIDTSNLTIRSFEGDGYEYFSPEISIYANSSAYENTSSSVSLNVSDTLLVEDSSAGIFMYANGKKAGNLSLNAGNISTPVFVAEATGVNEDGGGDGGEVNLKARNIRTDYLRADASGGRGRWGNPDGGNAGSINLDVQENLAINDSDGAGVFLYATGGAGLDRTSSSGDGGDGGNGGEIHATIGTLTGNLTADISGGDGGDGYSVSGNPNGNGGDGGDSPQNSIDLVLGSATGTITATADGGAGGNAGTSGTGTAEAGDGGDGGRITVDLGSLAGTVSTSVAGGGGGYDSGGLQTGTSGSAGTSSVTEGGTPSGPGSDTHSGIDLRTPDDISDAFTRPAIHDEQELSQSAQDKIHATLKELEALGWTIDYEKQLQVVVGETTYYTCHAKDPKDQEIWLAFNLNGDLLSNAGSTPGTISPALQTSISQLSGFAFEKNHLDTDVMNQAAAGVKTKLSEIDSGIREAYSQEGEEALADFYNRIQESTPESPRAAGSRCPASFTPDQREAQLKSDYSKNTLLALEAVGKNRTQDSSVLNTGMTFAWQSTITTLSRNSVRSMEANIDLLTSHQTGGKIWSDKEMNYYQNHESAATIVPTDLKTLKAISGETALEATPLDDVGFGDVQVKKLLPYISEGKFTDETVNMSMGCYQATKADQRISSYVASTRENRNL